MRTIFFTWLVLTTYCVQAQTLRGEVFDADTKKPIVAASVFLNNTGIGSITKEDGRFEISPFPSGKYDLVVSCIGYETYTKYLLSSEIGTGLKIYLRPQAKTLDEVVVQSYEKDGWYTWGPFFLEHFIGISAYAKEVYLKNPEVIRFRYDKKNQVLSAFAKEPLIIENNALGYRLRYDLIEFTYSFLAERVIVKGYPFFQEMETDRPSRRQQWVKNRNDVYEGSMMHFFRSLFRNRLSQNGFELRPIVWLTKAEKKLTEDSINRRPDPVNMEELARQIQERVKLVPLNSTNDSEKKFSDTTNQLTKTEYLIPLVIPADSVAYYLDSSTVGFYFKNFLQVTYVKKKEPSEISQALSGVYPFSNPLKNSIEEEIQAQMKVGVSWPILEHRRPSQGLISKLELIGGKEITVWANGAFYESTDILSVGYWAFWERIATLLPLDFKPTRNKKAP